MVHLARFVHGEIQIPECILKMVLNCFEQREDFADRNLRLWEFEGLVLEFLYYELSAPNGERDVLDMARERNIVAENFWASTAMDQKIMLFSYFIRPLTRGADGLCLRRGRQSAINHSGCRAGAITHQRDSGATFKDIICSRFAISGSLEHVIWLQLNMTVISYCNHNHIVLY